MVDRALTFNVSTSKRKILKKADRSEDFLLNVVDPGLTCDIIGQSEALKLARDLHLQYRVLRRAT